MIGTLIAKRKVPEGFDAFRRRDIDGFLKDWHDEAVLIYPGNIPGISGTHTGKEAIHKFYEHDFEQFPTLQIKIQNVAISNLFDMVGNNVIALHWKADAINHNGYRIKNSGVNIMTIKRGKVVQLHTYIFNTGEEFRRAWGVEQ